MNFAVFYFSGTGNTKWAVDELSECIIQKGHNCEIISLEHEKAKPEDVINKADAIGFAFPVYGANMPALMNRFLESLKNADSSLHGKPVFIMTTAGYIDGFGPFAANKILKSCGLKLIAYINLKLSNNISTPKIKASFQTGEKLKKRMERGKVQIEKLVNRILHNKMYIRNIGPYLLPGIFIRKASKNGLLNNYLALGVDNGRCGHCMLCVNKCPTKSIVFSNGNFEFLPSCTACMRCYNFCPKYAIKHEGKYADPEIYKRYKGPDTVL